MPSLLKLLSCIVFLGLVLTSCSEKSGDRIVCVRISLDSDTVHVYRSQRVSTEIRISDITAVSRVEIRKKGLGGVSEVIGNVDKEVFGQGAYRYEYYLNAGEKNSFYIVFVAYDERNEIVASKNLFVEPKPMIYTDNLKMIAKLTGKLRTPDHKPGVLSPNNTLDVDVGGTDLGIMWKMSDDMVGYWFGDTVGKDWDVTDTGGPGIGSNWRSNVLAFSSDTDPEDGIELDSWLTDGKGNARQVIYSEHDTSGNGDFTSIPTAAVRLGDKDYVHYMNVRTWTSSKGWDTNFSSLCESSDNGMTWRDCCNEISFSGNSHFAQVCYAKGDDGYVYMIGTQSGRKDAAYLSRFKPEDILLLQNYEYWCGSEGWEKQVAHAVPVFEAPVSEISLMYHKKYKRWLVTYLNEFNGIVLRHSEKIEGEWSDDYNIVSGYDYPGMYSPYMFPLVDDEDRLYFTMSMWWYYNVYIMSVDMKFCE